MRTAKAGPLLAAMLLAVAVAVAVAVTLPHPAAAGQGARSPHTWVFYTVRVGVKGGGTLTDDVGGPTNGDMAHETLTSSFTLDGTVPNMVLYGGRSPRRGEKSGAGYSRAAVNGSWNAQGTKWVDRDNQVTAPFTCGGRIDSHVAAQMQVSWARRGSSLSFTLTAVQQELYDLGWDACPNDTSQGPESGTEPTVYETRFSIPLSAIGNRTIKRPFSGPLAENRIYFLQRCSTGSGESCNMAWQGVAHFTRTRAVKMF